MPEPPFPHLDMVKLGRLVVVPSLHHPAFAAALQAPSVIFASHPSLRCGDIVHLIRVFGTSARNTLICTGTTAAWDRPRSLSGEPHRGARRGPRRSYADPLWDMDEALAPYRPLAMRTAYTPLDARLTAADANSLVGRIRPRILCAPASRTSAAPDARQRQQGARRSLDHCSAGAAWFVRASAGRNASTECRRRGADAPAAAAAQPDRRPLAVRDAPAAYHRTHARHPPTCRRRGRARPDRSERATPLLRGRRSPAPPPASASPCAL